MQNTTSDEIVVYLDKQRLIQNAVPLAVLALGLAGSAALLRRGGGLLGRLLAGLANTILLWLGSFGFSSLLRLLFPSPVVKVNAEGITYDPPSAGPFNFGGTLGWDEIESLYICEIVLPRGRDTREAKFLCIQPRNVDAFFQHYNWLSRVALGVTMSRTGSPFMISDAFLALSADELFAQVREQYQEVIQENGIALLDARKVLPSVVANVASLRSQES